MTTHVLNGLAVEIDGEGEALLCIHGLGGSSNNWTPVLPALGGFRRIRPDLPGSAERALPGRSGRITLKPDNAGSSGVQVLEEPPRPWMHNTASPSPSISTAMSFKICVAMDGLRRTCSR